MALSTPYQTLLTFNRDKLTSSELVMLISTIDELELALSGFSEFVSRYTRRENRAYLVYLIGLIRDELTEHPKELRDNNTMACADILGDKFDEIMTTTRSKDLYKSGEQLRTCLTTYDSRYTTLKKAVADSEL